MADKDKKDTKLFNTKYVANLFKRDESSIQKLAKGKILPYVEKTREGYQFDLPKTMIAYIYYLQEIVDRRPKNTEEQEKQRLEAEIKLKEAKAEIAQIDLKELKGEMLRACDVQAFIEDLAATTKSLLMGLPGRLAMDLAHANTASEKSAIIEEAIFEVLNQLTEYDFNIDFYKQRVAERHGRSIDNGEEENED
jgi:phage terminase Nu1 subunit (DNA packaging protein)